MQYLDEILFKNSFLIPCKNYLIPARGDVFHKRDLAFANEKSRLSEAVFFHVTVSSPQADPIWIFKYINKVLYI